MAKDHNDYKEPLRLKKVINREEAYGLQIAASKGELKKVISLLSLKRPIRSLSEISKENHSDVYVAFSFAAASGHLEVMRYFLGLTMGLPGLMAEMIHSWDDLAFRRAAYNGRLEAVDYFLTKLIKPAELDKVIHAEKDFAFRHAAENGHLEVVKYLVSIASPTMWHSMTENLEADTDCQSLEPKIVTYLERVNSNNINTIFGIKYEGDKIVSVGKHVTSSMIDNVIEAKLPLESEQQIALESLQAYNKKQLSSSISSNDIEFSWVERTGKNSPSPSNCSTFAKSSS